MKTRIATYPNKLAAEVARRALTNRGYAVSAPFQDRRKNWCLTVLVWGVR